MPTLKKFSFHGPSGNIEGVAHLPEYPAVALAIVAHPLPTMGGTMENKVAVTLAKTFADLSCIAVRFNFRGVGTSEGEFTGGDGEEQDMLAVVRYTQDQFGESLPLIFSGFSFGGYVAARVALKVQPRHLILAAPAVGRFNMPDVPAHTVLIHGEKDEVVALGDVLAWASPQQLPVIVLPSAGHFFHGRLNQLRGLVKHYFTGEVL